ncbi:MAG: imidazole glycerol phosphate synthase subunit HisH [Fimbriimonadales bacterium]|nr:imidazole glycerol phosphate synthase subunit HisH [Fimbriimonadales bacterium]
MSEVLIVPTGTANLASIEAAFARLNTPTRIATGATDIDQANHVVLPGVGSFGAAMEAIKTHSLFDSLCRRFDEQLPVLAICLGMQLLFEGSEESPTAKGLGIIKGHAARLTGAIRVPHMGWNHISSSGFVLQSGYAYFANSYRVESVSKDWSTAIVEYGGKWIAGIEKGPLVACQFHPELSGEWGLNMISRWLRC